MHSSATVARAARVLIAAALAFGPSVDPATGQDVRRPPAAAGRVATAGDALRADLDPHVAAGEDLVVTLKGLHDLVDERAAATAASRAAHEEATDRLEAANAARAEAERRVADVDPAAAAVAAAQGGGGSRAAMPFGAWHARSGLAPFAGLAGDRAGPAALEQAGAALEQADRALDAAAEAAERSRREAESAATGLADAEAQEADLVAATEERLEDRLARAATLAEDDADAAQAVRGEEAAVGEALVAITGEPNAAARPEPPPPPPPPPLPDPTGAASGAVEAVACPAGGWLVVDSSIAGNVQRLLDDAAAGGIDMCAKSGFRSRAEQIELRRAHCGTSEYAVFDAPPSSCSPPTARPGTSNHESGLAVDFSCADGQPMTHASPCFGWLAAHAPRYGLHNLPSEPWHWSTTGR
ncbi:MAG TPA: M15 family metallopeptidase [Acidimicrobiales bacterium]